MTFQGSSMDQLEFLWLRSKVCSLGSLGTQLSEKIFSFEETDTRSVRHGTHVLNHEVGGNARPGELCVGL